MRMSGGLRSIAARSFWGVSPVRMPTLMSPPIPRSGARRLRSMSYESAFSGETYTSRVVRSPSGGGVAVRRSRPQRKAASVLPEPVGADSSTSSPRAIAGHAWSWAAVGSSKARRNHSRTWGVNDSSDACFIRPTSVSRPAQVAGARSVLALGAPGQLAGLALELGALAAGAACRRQREGAARLALRHRSGHVGLGVGSVARALVRALAAERVVRPDVRIEDVRVGLARAAVV